LKSCITFGGFVIVFFLSFCIIGCTDDIAVNPDNETPMEFLPYVMGEVWGPAPGDSLSFVGVNIANCPSIPAVSVNGVLFENFGIPDGTFEFVQDDVPIYMGDSFRIEVDYTKMDGAPCYAWCDHCLPGDFELISPPPDSVVELELYEDLTFEWGSSEGADRYYLDFHYRIYYHDLAGDLHTKYFYLDTVMQDLSLTISAGDLYPDEAEVDSIDFYQGSGLIYSGNGPHDIGDMSNVEGDAYGFFTGYTHGSWIDFFSPGYPTSDGIRTEWREIAKQNFPGLNQ